MYRLSKTVACPPDEEQKSALGSVAEDAANVEDSRDTQSTFSHGSALVRAWYNEPSSFSGTCPENGSSRGDQAVADNLTGKELQSKKHLPAVKENRTGEPANAYWSTSKEHANKTRDIPVFDDDGNGDDTSGNQGQARNGTCRRKTTTPGAVHMAGIVGSFRGPIDPTDTTNTSTTAEQQPPTVAQVTPSDNDQFHEIAIPDATLVTDNPTAQASLEKCSIVLCGKRIHALYLVVFFALIISLTVGLSLTLAKGDDDGWKYDNKLNRTFLEILSPLTVGGEDDFADTESTQYAAIRWLSVEDLAYATTLSPNDLIQRYIVVLILTARGGVEWVSALPFETVGTHECSWHGLLDKRHEMGFFCEMSHDELHAVKIVSRIKLLGEILAGNLVLAFKHSVLTLCVLRYRARRITPSHASGTICPHKSNRGCHAPSFQRGKLALGHWKAGQAAAPRPVRKRVDR